MSTPILNTPEIAESQANKYLTHNEALRRLEAVLIRALSDSTTEQPSSPSEGDSYIIPDESTGSEWEGYSEGDVAFYMGGDWHALTPPVGLRLYIVDTGSVKQWSGTSWAVGGGVSQFTGLSDTPSSYTDHGGKAVRVNSAQTDLEFFEAALAQHTHEVGDIQDTGGSEGQVPTIDSEGNVVWATPPGAGGGESNDGTNVGTGAGVYKDKSGATLRFRSLTAGSGISIDVGADEIEITATGGSGTEGFFNVADYPSVQGAVDAAELAGGGTVFLPAGTYDLEASLAVPSNVRILGAGVGAAIIRAHNNLADDAAVIECGNSNNIEVAHLTIDGNKARSGGSFNILGEGLSADGGGNLWFHHLHIHDALGEGIDCDGVSGVFVSNVLAEDCAGNGIHLSDPLHEQSVISDCITRRCGLARRDAGDPRHGGFALRGTEIVLSNCVSVDDARSLDIETQGLISISNVIGRTPEHAGTGGPTAADDTGTVLRVTGVSGERVTLNNCSLEHDGTHDQVAFAIKSNVNVVVIGGAYRSTGSASMFFCDAGGDLTITGGLFSGPAASHTFNLRDVGGVARLSGATLTGDARSLRTRNGWAATMTGCSVVSGAVELETNDNIIMGNELASITGTAGSIVRNNVVNGTFFADSNV